jgi:hypothetical protein
MRTNCILLFLLTSFVSLAQLPQYHARLFDARHGLNANTIIDIFKDKEDLLWVIYNYSNTVERFDGRTVEKFSFNEPIIHYLNDDKNNTWMIGAGSIGKLEEGANHFQKINFDTASRNRLVRIFQVPGKPVILLTTKSFYEWNEKEQVFNKVNKPFLPPAQRNSPTYFDKCGNTIFYPGRQLYAYNYITGKADSLPSSSLYSVYAFTPSLAIFVKYDGSAYWADFANKKATLLDAKKYFPGENIVHFRVTGVTPLSKEKFLVLTTAGLMEYDLKTDRFTRMGVYADGTPFEYENVLSRLFVDKDGIAWAHAETMIATLSPLSKTLGLIRNKEQDPEKKWNNAVASFAEDNENRLWIGTGFGFARLNYLTGDMEVFHPVENATDQLNHESVRGILFDGTNVILGPSNKGIWIYNPQTKKYKRPLYENDSARKLSEGDFYDMIYSLPNGDHIFPGRDALYVMDAKTYKLRILPMPPGINYNVAFQDSEHRIWIGTMSSVFCLDENYTIQFQIKTKLSSVFCLFETSPGNLLIGTSTGLYKMKINGAETIAEFIPTAMGTNPVLTIFRDSLNHYWFSTTNGLYLSDGDITAFRKFDYADNIQSLLFAGNSFIRTRSGLVFFGGRHGINYFKPEDFSLQDNPLSVKIKAIYTTSNDTLTVEHFNNHSYSYNKGRLSFNVVTPYFFNAEKIEFRYKLKGLNEDWISNGNNHIISFSALPDGKYELVVAASTNGKIWYETKQPLVFVVNPPFWKTWWFVLSTGLAIIAILYFLQKRREKILHDKEEEKLQKQKLAAENLQYKLEANQSQLAVLENERKAATAKLQSMRLQMNPHFLFNALNSIQQMIMTGNEEKATLYLSKFSKLLRMVLTHSDREVVTLKEEIEMLKLYIELEALRFEDTFTYSIDIEKGIDLNDNKVPTLLIQPFVENAIWHGLLHKEGIRSLKIHFSDNQSESLQCVVEDNGIGREAARAFAKKSSQNNHTSKGVSVAEERLKIFNEHNNDSSKLEIDDLKYENGEAAGTKVIITLPNLS